MTPFTKHYIVFVGNFNICVATLSFIKDLEFTVRLFVQLIVHLFVQFTVHLFAQFTVSLFVQFTVDLFVQFTLHLFGKKILAIDIIVISLINKKNEK